MYKAAIRVIEHDRGRRFNPNMIDRVVDALKLAYGNYYRERQKPEGAEDTAGEAEAPESGEEEA